MVNIETDKVLIPVNSPASGVMAEQHVDEGGLVEVGGDLFTLDTSKSDANHDPKSPKASVKDSNAKDSAGNYSNANAKDSSAGVKNSSSGVKNSSADVKDSSASVKVSSVKENAEKAKDSKEPENHKTDTILETEDERIPMGRMRMRIAERMKEAQNTSASLTTFNEIDMSALKSLRQSHGPAFFERNNLKLSFMSPFIRAAALLLHQPEFRILNARIAPTTPPEIVHPAHVHLAVAVASSRGLLTPILREAEQKTTVEIEAWLKAAAERARSAETKLEELVGGTFTISNGGVFGSLMGTPILNAGQSAVLGMHAIKERPVVVGEGQIAARPMMYVALTYDHRLIDGKEAVQFLVRLKEYLEDPASFLLDL